ncbi:hypothetical protein ABTL57_19175, partial [Acinetobacter baumannii]
MSDSPKLHGITAYVMVPSVAAAAGFDNKAFGATGVMRLPICDPFPEPGVDGWYHKAVAAGAEGTLAPHDAFWGDRFARLVDPSQQ